MTRTSTLVASSVVALCLSMIVMPAAQAQLRPPSKATLDMANQKRAAPKPKAPVDAGSLKPYPGSRPFVVRTLRSKDKKGAAAVAAAATAKNRKGAFYTSDPAPKILAYYKDLHKKAGYQLMSEDSFKTQNGTDVNTQGHYLNGRIVVVQVYHGKMNYSEYAEDGARIPAGSNLIIVDISGN